MILFVAGLPSDFDEVDFKEMFELYGEITSARLIIDRNTGKSKGYGFIEMPNDNDAKETIQALEGASIKGKKMSVKEAEPQQPPRQPRSFNRNDDNRFNRRDDNRFNRRDDNRFNRQ